MERNIPRLVLLSILLAATVVFSVAINLSPKWISVDLKDPEIGDGHADFGLWKVCVRANHSRSCSRYSDTVGLDDLSNTLRASQAFAVIGVLLAGTAAITSILLELHMHCLLVRPCLVTPRVLLIFTGFSMVLCAGAFTLHYRESYTDLGKLSAMYVLCWFTMVTALLTAAIAHVHHSPLDPMQDFSPERLENLPV
eukprot:scpid69930/ scgid18500/ 